MATTFLKPLHAGKGHSIAQALGRSTDYVKNPDKTDNGEWVSAYQCNPSIVDAEFLFAKRQYAAYTGKAHKDNDVIAYHLRQSFKPGEVTPEKANKIGKHLAFKIPEGKRFIRCDSLSEDYTENSIRERLEGKRKVKQQQVQKALPAKEDMRPRSLIDIQSKLVQANSPGFERWAKTYNLKEIAQTVLWMKEHGISDVEKLAGECDAAVERYHELADKTKANEARMKEIAELQQQIGTYSKTREVYLEYKKLPQKKQAEFYEAHRGDIMLHEAAKRYFDSLGLEKLPSIKALKQEYAV